MKCFSENIDAFKSFETSFFVDSVSQRHRFPRNRTESNKKMVEKLNSQKNKVDKTVLPSWILSK